jgi:oligopeptide transport system ATP-binding protein
MTVDRALVEVRHVRRDIPIRKGFVFPRQVGTFHAVDDVSLTVRAGETLALVGQSGAGKSTLGRMMLGLLEPTGGEIIFDGESLYAASKQKRREITMQAQLVFQEPMASLNPQLPVSRSIELPLVNLGWDRERRRQRVSEVLDMVNLSPTYAERYPHQFSGGQAQRVAIARALAGGPKFVVLDELVSALDVTIQAQIVNLLKDLQEKLKLTYLFIAHNLDIVYYMSDRVAVMSHGRLVEFGDCDEVIRNPRQDITRELVSSSGMASRDSQIIN